jgi:hypothetical protein
MIKKLSIIAFVLLLFVTSVSAAVPVLNYDAVSDTIKEGDNTAIYSFSITNTATTADRYQLYTISAFWDINPSIVLVPAKSATAFNLEITLNSNDLVGPQLVPVTIKSLNSGDTVEENLYVYVKPSTESSLSYVPNVAMTVNMAESIDPRNPLSIEMEMVNRNPLNISDLRIVIESSLFSKEVQTTLGPLERKTNQVLLSMNKLQEPGVYQINIKLVTQNRTVTELQKEIRVESYSQVTEEHTKVKRLFSRSEYIKLHNDGNYETIKQLKIQRTFFQKMFTSSSEKYSKLKENGVTYLTWDVPLAPQQSFDLVVRTNYNSIAILVVLILAGIALYYIFRSPVLLFKRAKIVASSEDGITEIRVRLHLKNRSGKEIHAVKVIDRHPKIVSLVEDNSIGSLKPTKMLSADKVHSLLMWNLEALEPYEERLLSYTIRSKLDIVGNMHLHSAKVRFMTPTGERTTSSNDVTLLHKSVNMVKYE